MTVSSSPQAKPFPTFSLPCDNGLTISNLSIKDKWTVMFLYPKDDTSGCTKEALEFSELKEQFDKLNVNIYGLSKDSIKSHLKFKTKHNLTIDLLSDEALSLIEPLGCWIEKTLYGKKYMGAERSSFLISPDGIIIHEWRNVKVESHAKNILDKISSILS